MGRGGWPSVCMLAHKGWHAKKGPRKRRRGCDANLRHLGSLPRQHAAYGQLTRARWLHGGAGAWRGGVAYRCISGGALSLQRTCCCCCNGRAARLARGGPVGCWSCAGWCGCGGRRSCERSRGEERAGAGSSSRSFGGHAQAPRPSAQEPTPAGGASARVHSAGALPRLLKATLGLFSRSTHPPALPGPRRLWRATAGPSTGGLPRARVVGGTGVLVPCER